jgi:hypothetical protein
VGVDYGGLWNRLEVLLAGIWWLGIGLATRKERPAFGNTSMILGAASLLDRIGNILGIGPVAETGLSIYLYLAPVWALWFGVSLLRSTPRIADAPTAATLDDVIIAAALQQCQVK